MPGILSSYPCVVRVQDALYVFIEHFDILPTIAFHSYRSFRTDQPTEWMARSGGSRPVGPFLETWGWHTRGLSSSRSGPSRERSRKVRPAIGSSTPGSAASRGCCLSQKIDEFKFEF